MREKIGVRCPHLSFCFSCMLLNIIASSQHPRHWNDFRSQLMNLIIHHRNRLFFVCQVFIHFHTSEATTRAKSLKYTSSASRHGTLDVLVTYSEVKPTDIQPCQFSPVSLKVQRISVLTFHSCQTSSHISSVTPSRTQSPT